MAAADYRLCDVCTSKTFYDAQLDYDFKDPERPHGLYGLGDWKVICIDCASAYECVIITKQPPRTQESERKQHAEATKMIVEAVLVAERTKTSAEIKELRETMAKVIKTADIIDARNQEAYAEIERLRAALKEIANLPSNCDEWTAQPIAQAALENR